MTTHFTSHSRLLSIFILLTFFGFFSANAQESKVVKILNRELGKEAKARLKDIQNVADSLVIIQPYSLDKNNTLSLTVKQYLADGEGFEIIKQEVPINKIKFLNKDINVIFETEEAAVTITTTTYATTGPVKSQSVNAGTFYTHLYSIKENESLSRELQKAFKKAGVAVMVNFWAD